MSKTKKIIAAAIGVVSVGTMAQAATVTITPVASYYGTSLSDLNTFNHQVGQGGVTTQQNGFYEVDYYAKVQLSSADATAGFYGLGNVVFNEAVTGGVALNGDYAGDAANSTVNTTAGMQNGYWGNTISSAKGQTLAGQWNQNNDGGSNAHDGLDITVGIPTGLATADPRTTWGQSGQAAVLTGYENLATNNPGSTQFYIGHQIVQVTAGGTIAGLAPNPAFEGYSLYNGTYVIQVVNGITQTLSLPSLQLGAATPEPTSLALLSVGGLLAVRRRRA